MSESRNISWCLCSLLINSGFQNQRVNFPSISDQGSFQAWDGAGEHTGSLFASGCAHCSVLQSPDTSATGKSSVPEPQVLQHLLFCAPRLLSLVLHGATGWFCVVRKSPSLENQETSCIWGGGHREVKLHTFLHN